jgi:hypothetical protein
MTAARISTRYLTVGFVAAVAAYSFSVFIFEARATENCSPEISQSIEQARKALTANDSIQDRAALVCLVEAVAALDARLSGLSSGAIPFDGQVYAPKGVVITKPPAKEAD